MSQYVDLYTAWLPKEREEKAKLHVLLNVLKISKENPTYS
jgi:hypothetical protein